MVFSLFPDLFILAPVAVTLIRVLVGMYCVWLGVRAFAEARRAGSGASAHYAVAAALVLALCGALLIVGLYTQGAALVSAVLMLLATERSFRDVRLAADRALFLLVGTVSFALLFLGPGALAVDMPL